MMQAKSNRWTGAATGIAMLVSGLVSGGAASAMLIPNAGPYIVYFDWNRADLTPEAITVLDAMTNQWAGDPSKCYALIGHTDRAGAAARNLRLSQRMTRNVANYLISRGIAATSVETISHGETRPRVPTPDGVREPQNRRVEILIQSCSQVRTGDH